MPEPPPKAVEEVEAPPAVTKKERKIPEPTKGTNFQLSLKIQICMKKSKRTGEN